MCIRDRPYAGLAFLAIPAFGFTGFYTVILLIGALAVDLLLARLLRLILGTVWIPSAVDVYKRQEQEDQQQADDYRYVQSGAVHDCA